MASQCTASLQPHCRSPMTPFNLSLRALQHPYTLLSIGVLLLNDHVLKAAVPSWFTGKLSDFAGLFFFPFVLLALLAWPLTALRLRPRQALAIAILTTGAWFTLLKTVPAINHLTAQLAGWFVGGNVVIVLDPSDLLALPMLGLAWQFGQRVARVGSACHPSKRAYLALGLATLASIATSPCMPPLRVLRVLAHDSVLYAGLDSTYGNQYEVFQSVDGGSSWQYVEPGATITQPLQEAVTLPKTVCLTTAAQHCYRITGAEAVEETLDGGQHWNIAWQIPWGRRRFMERSVLNTCKQSIDVGPYDITLYEANGEHTVLVATGNEGLLRRTPTGEWQRLALMTAEPTPYVAADGSLNNESWLPYVLAELFWSVLAAFLVLAALSTCAWVTVLRPRAAPTWWTYWPLAGVFVFMLLALAAGMILSPSLTNRAWSIETILYSAATLIFAGLFFFQPLIGLALISFFGLGWGVSWWWVRDQAHLKYLSLTCLSILLTASGVALTAIYYVCWAIGLIPLYEIALGLAWLTIGLVVWFGYREVRHYSQLAQL